MSGENFTQTPNNLLDNVGRFTGAELKVLLFIFRKTKGFHKKADQISYSTFLGKKGKGCGTQLSRQGLSNALASLEEMGVIEIDRTSNTSEYSINSSQLSRLVNSVDQNSKVSRPESSQLSRHTKESIKETTKESVQLLRNLTIEDFPEEKKIKRFTVYCWKSVKRNFPDHKTVREAKFKTWFNPLRLLHEQDEVSLYKAKTIWDWAVKDSFWKANIRSTSKFRDQYETLDAQMSTGQAKNEEFQRPHQQIV